MFGAITSSGTLSPKRAAISLQWAVTEMERRYKDLAGYGVRNIDGYNARLAQAAAKREAAEVEALAPKPGIHGEVGVEVGTGGHRAAFGTAYVPLGKDSGATVTFVTQSGPQYYGRRRR